MLVKIVSGGQTGADIAALDVALRHGFPHGGWCPKERKSLDGPLPARYHLIETPSESHLQSIEWNVRECDGTVVFTLAPEASRVRNRNALLVLGILRRCAVLVYYEWRSRRRNLQQSTFKDFHDAMNRFNHQPRLRHRHVPQPVNP